jgi:sortase (surface protein transpeptidase)
MKLGLTSDGALEVPPGGFPAGWFTGAPTPGELGPAVIAGHVHWVDGPGVFWRLREVRPGDLVSVTRRDGSIARFRVTSSRTFPKSRFPTERVYGDIEHAGLRLITCGGYDEGSESYEANVVVFAELVDVTELARLRRSVIATQPGVSHQGEV